MRRFIALGWMLGCLGACGGQAKRSTPTDEGSGATTGFESPDATAQGGSETNPNYGGSANASFGGSAPVTDGECRGEPPPGGCTRSCGDDGGSYGHVYCDDGKWSCYDDDWVLRDECPENSCARGARYCCDELGRLSAAACDANGAREPCPTGATATDEHACRPTGVSSCSDLDGNACPTEGAECHSGGWCSPVCKCQKVGIELEWECQLLTPC